MTRAWGVCVLMCCVRAWGQAGNALDAPAIALLERRLREFERNTIVRFGGLLRRKHTRVGKLCCCAGWCRRNYGEGGRRVLLRRRPAAAAQGGPVCVRACVCVVCVHVRFVLCMRAHDVAMTSVVRA